MAIGRARQTTAIGRWLLVQPAFDARKGLIEFHMLPLVWWRKISNKLLVENLISF
jgi:hypothetical protein